MRDPAAFPPKRGEFKGHRAKESGAPPGGVPLRRGIADEIAALDADILQLLLRRYNLLQKLHTPGQRPGARPPAQTEQTLRLAWEKNAARISRDPRVLHRLFALIRELEFLPKPVPGEEPRPAFGLAPPARPVSLDMPGPSACRRTRLFLFLAASGGCALRIEHTLLNDPLIECIKAFNQTGAGLSWEESGAVAARAGKIPPLPDKVLFVGNDTLNFYLLLGRYLLQPSHAKFTGDAGIRLHDLTPLCRFAPSLGARLTCIVPKSGTLPARLEASGLLPEKVLFPGDLPADAISGLLVAAACGPQTMHFDLSAHGEADTVLEEALSVLQACKTKFSREGRRVRIEPGICPPPEPAAGIDLTLALPLLALSAFCGGSVRLRGNWPSCNAARQVEYLLQCAGLNTERTPDGICSRSPEQKRQPTAPDLTDLPSRFLLTALSIAALPALRGRAVPLPELPGEDTEQSAFLEALGLRLEGDMILPPTGPVSRDATPWAASTPSSALAFALAAFARPHLKLANPGIMTSLYPSFWHLYNNLLLHGSVAAQPEKEYHDAAPQRKRVRLNVPAGIGEPSDGTDN